MNRQAIAPVIAVTLLLVTAVLSAVFFQTWFQTFQSGLLIDVESQSQANNFRIDIEELLGEKLFVNAGDGLNITKISIDGNDCNFTGVVTGVSGINVSDCIENLTTNTPSVIMVTNGSVISDKVFVRDNLNEVLVTGFDCNPICSENILFDSYNNLYWIRNLSLITFRPWSVTANETYSVPLWNETINEYIWPNNLTINDYPAFRDCVNLNIDGYNDWRLPTQQELLNLGNNEIGGWGDSNFSNYGFLAFPGFYWFWTSIETALPNAAFDVRLISGVSSSAGKTTGRNVVCVRQD